MEAAALTHRHVMVGPGCAEAAAAMHGFEWAPQHLESPQRLVGALDGVASLWLPVASGDGGGSTCSTLTCSECGGHGRTEGGAVEAGAGAGAVASTLTMAAAGLPLARGRWRAAPLRRATDTEYGLVHSPAMIAALRALGAGAEPPPGCGGIANALDFVIAAGVRIADATPGSQRVRAEEVGDPHHNTHNRV